MDRDWSRDRAESGPVLPSRRAALEALRRAVATGSGPALLTGEPGAGKTWLVGRLRRESEGRGPDAPRWLAVDLAPTTNPADLLRSIAVGLGLLTDGQPTAGALRLALTDCLTERSTDSRRWALVIDEAHLATPEVLEEVRVLSNRLGQPDGFAALVLVGQTSLARRLATRPLAALEARLSARVHLDPIDADEARALLGPGLDDAEVERRHRDAAGNPGRLLRQARSVTAPGPRRSIRVEPAQPVPPPSVPLVQARPPLLVEDGLIEVGWDSEPEDTPGPVGEASPAPHDATPPTAPAPPVDEVVDDPYAALQAWNEWSANQGRLGPGAGGEASALRDNPNLRAEGQEEFAPYSQLFSRRRATPSGE